MSVTLGLEKAVVVLMASLVVVFVVVAASETTPKVNIFAGLCILFCQLG